MTLHLLTLLVCLLLLPVTINAAATESFSPIRNLEASLAASVASSTTVAVPCDADDCVVVLTASPRRKSSLLAVEEKTRQPQHQLFGLAAHKPPVACSDRWNLVSNCLLTMTGFRADVDHLLGVWSRSLESHYSVYQKPMALHKCLRELSDPIQRATQRDGGRPFGVHALLVGRDNDGGWQLFTCDPTGLEQHHVPKGPVVIGKDFVDLMMTKEGANKNEEASSAREAMKACLRILTREHVPESMEGLIVWWNAGRTEVVQIDAEELNRCRQELLQKKA